MGGGCREGPRAASAGAPVLDADRFPEPDPVAEGLVHGAADGDLRQARPHPLVEVALDEDLAVDALDEAGLGVVAVLAIPGVAPAVAERHGDPLERDPLVPGVQRERDARARAQRAEE